MIVKIKKHVKYKKLSFYDDNGFDVIKGLEDYIKKKKPDILSMITHSRKFPETIWKTSWTNKMANHTTIPLLILHRIKLE